MPNILIASGSTSYMDRFTNALAKQNIRPIMDSNPSNIGYQLTSKASRIDFVIVHDSCNAPEVLNVLQDSGWPQTKTLALVNLDTNASYFQGHSLECLKEQEISPTSLAAYLASKLPASAGTSNSVSMSRPVQSGQIIAINSPKGGVGKTSLSIELANLMADSFAKSGRRETVCLVDMNPSFDTMATSMNCVRQARMWDPEAPTVMSWVHKIEEKAYNQMNPSQRQALVNDPQHSFVPFLMEQGISFSWDELRPMLIRNEESGLYVLPSVPLPFDVQYVCPEYVSLILGLLKQYFTYIVVDTGNYLTDLTLESMHFADKILLVTTPNTASITVMSTLLKNTNRILLDSNNLSLVVNSISSAKGVEPAKAASILNLPLAGVLPYDGALPEFHEKGQTYAVQAVNSAYYTALYSLAEKICNMPARQQPIRTVGVSAAPVNRQPAPVSTPAQPPKKKGFFAKLFGR